MSLHALKTLQLAPTAQPPEPDEELPKITRVGPLPWREEARPQDLHAGLCGLFNGARLLATLKRSGLA